MKSIPEMSADEWHALMDYLFVKIMEYEALAEEARDQLSALDEVFEQEQRLAAEEQSEKEPGQA